MRNAKKDLGSSSQFSIHNLKFLHKSKMMAPPQMTIIKNNRKADTVINNQRNGGLYIHRFFFMVFQDLLKHDASRYFQNGACNKAGFIRC